MLHDSGLARLPSRGHVTAAVHHANAGEGLCLAARNSRIQRGHGWRVLMSGRLDSGGSVRHQTHRHRSAMGVSATTAAPGCRSCSEAKAARRHRRSDVWLRILNERCVAVSRHGDPVLPHSPGPIKAGAAAGGTAVSGVEGKRASGCGCTSRGVE